MWSFYNKEILIGIFPSDRDWWEDQWTVWRLERVLGASLISWHRHNAPRLWSECAAWVWWHPREVIISGRHCHHHYHDHYHHFPYHLLMKVNPRAIVSSPNKHWMLTEMILIILLSVVWEERMGPKAHTALSSPESLLGPNITFLSDFLSKVAINCVSEIKLFSIKFQ